MGDDIRLSTLASLANASACNHRAKVVCTEADGCYWMQCAKCTARGPKRHSVVLAHQSAHHNMKVRNA